MLPLCAVRMYIVFVWELVSATEPDAKLAMRIVKLAILFLFSCFSIRRHPLFSLLALMLEKCEQATQGYIPKSSSSTTSSSSPNGTSNGSNGGGESDSFTKDIQAFVQMLEKENRPLLTNDAELDGLVRNYSLRFTTPKTYTAHIPIVFSSISDDQGIASPSDTFAGIGKGARVVQGLLHTLHCLFAWQNAIGESAAFGLSARTQQ